jgi:hypothetical protein
MMRVVGQPSRPYPVDCCWCCKIVQEVTVFVETITQPAAEWRHWTGQLRLLDDPPAALVASIAWEPGDGTITNVNVWDSPGAVGDFYLERVAAIVEADGEPEDKPIRHGEPVHVHVRCAQQGT